jgi:polar amino acid transport system substrate-binding protein
MKWIFPLVTLPVALNYSPAEGSNLDDIGSLAGRRIGVIANTTNEAVIKTQQPAAILVKVKNRGEGLQKLEAGEIDGFASDGITLEGLRKSAKNPNNLAIVPSYPYAYESYACTLPENDSKWREYGELYTIKIYGRDS